MRFAYSWYLWYISYHSSHWPNIQKRQMKRIYRFFIVVFIVQIGKKEVMNKRKIDSNKKKKFMEKNAKNFSRFVYN